MASATPIPCQSFPTTADANPLDWRSEYPFCSHHHRTQEGYRYHYLDEGAGLPIVMVHGNPTWSFYYRALVSRFRATHRTLAVDHMGCGLSDKPRHAPYHLAWHTENLRHWIESLDLRQITLVVHDWGGAIGLGAAVAMPHRFARIVLLNTGAFPPPYIPFRIRVCRYPLVGKWGVQGLNLFARAATWMAMQHPNRLGRAARDGLLAPYDTWQHRQAIYQFVRDIPTSRRHPTWNVLQNLENSLTRLSHLPVSMIWGMRDWCFRPDCLLRFQRHFPQAEVHKLDDVGHWVMEEAPDVVGDHLAKFLTQSSSVSSV